MRTKKVIPRWNVFAFDYYTVPRCSIVFHESKGRKLFLGEKEREISTFDRARQSIQTIFSNFLKERDESDRRIKTRQLFNIDAIKAPKFVKVDGQKPN